MDRSEGAALGRRRRRRPPTGGAVLVAVLAAAGLAGWAVIGGEGQRPSRLVVVSPAAAVEGPAGDADGPVPADGGGARPAPRVVAEPGCAGEAAYEMEGAPVAVRRGVVASLVAPADGSLTGPLGAFGPVAGAQIALDDPSVERQVLVAPDGAGVVRWSTADGPVALLSAKRVEPDVLGRLADALEAGDPGAAGFELVEPPRSPATVAGHSCILDGAFVGVETVGGDRAAVLSHLLSVDPTDVAVVDAGVVVRFDRRDGGHDLALDVVGTEEWARRVRAAAGTGP